MRRAPLVMAALAVAACTQPPTSLPSDLKDPEAMVVESPNLFIASTATDELRILSLNPNVSLEDYVEAPNPLYVLSIPVVTRPFAMAPDMAGDMPGNFLFVLSAAEDRLGIVAATVNPTDGGGLTELQEVALPGTPLSVAARTNPDGSARAFIGISNGTHGSIVVVDAPPITSFPAPGLGVNSSYADLQVAEPAGVALSPDGNTLAIADRLADEANPDPTQRRGGVILLDVSDPAGSQAGAAQRVDVGGPARKVIYSPASTEFVDGGGAIDPGKYLYVLLDNSGCELGQPCGGVQVVVDGQVPEASPGQPWQPMYIPGEATDISVGQGPYLNLPTQAGMGGAIRAPLLLTIPSTDGHIYFADGVEGRIYNVDYMAPSVVTGIVHTDQFGNALTLADGGYDLTGPTEIELETGAIHSGAVTITYLGTLPVLSNRALQSLQAGGSVGEVLTDSAAIFQDLGVEANDWVTFSASDNPACSQLLLVSTVGTTDGGALGPTQLELSGSLPAGQGCETDPTLRYMVAAGPASAEPYVVVEDVQGLLGRTQANSVFQSAPDYFYRPPGYDAAAPGIVFNMGPGTVGIDGGAPPQGEAWYFVVDGAVEPMFILGGANGLVPSVAAWDDDLASFFVAYPGSNVTSEVVQFAPVNIGYDTDSNVTEWE